MTLPYAEGNFSRKNKIMDFLKEKLIKHGQSKKYWLECLVVATYINQLFTEALNEISPDIFHFLKVMSMNEWAESVNEQGCIKIENSLGFITYKKFLSKEDYRFRFVSRYGKTVKLSKNKKTEQLDIKSVLRAHVANFIHSKDAVLNLMVVKAFRDQGLPISSTHDC
jgi:DNA-directed RNA polymerase